MTLDELKIGQTAAITAVGGEGALRNRLIDMGLIPRTRVTLRKVAPRDAFICRYGGDEFVLIGSAASSADIRSLCRLIHSALAQANGEANAPYLLDVSIGCAVQRSGYVTIPDIIRAADAELYKTKREKAQRAAL